ncbi:MAG: YveK family protein [Acidimicrobiales bacterium]
MELRRYLHLLRQRLLLIVLTIVAAVAAAWLITPRDAVYEARTTIYVGVRQFDLGEDSRDLSVDRLNALDRLLSTYSRMIDSRPVAEDALERLDLDRSPDSVVDATLAGPEPGTQLLVIAVTDRDPVVARDLANALAGAFVEKVQAFEGPGDPAEVIQEGEVPTGLPAYVYETARLPTQPLPTQLARNLLLAALFGFLAAAAVIFAVEYLDITVKDLTEAEHRLGLPVLGVIPLESDSAALKAATRASTRPARVSGPESVEVERA